MIKNSNRLIQVYGEQEQWPEVVTEVSMDI